MSRAGPVSLALPLLLGCTEPMPGGHAADRRGPGSADAAEVPGAPAGGELFDTDRVHTVALEIDEHDVAALNEDPWTWREGNVTLDGTRLERVGVRIKGSGTMQSFEGKPSLKIDLNRYVDQDHEGLELVQLHGLWFDEAQLHEALGWKVAETLGLPYSRVAFVRLSVNDVDFGLYAHVEAHDDRWMARTWVDAAEGRLYEGGFLWRGDEQVYADFTPDLVANFDLEEGEDVGGADLRAAVDAIVDPASDWYGRVDRALALDALVRLVAVEAWIGQWDGYAFAANNFRVFVNGGGRAEVLLSGLDGAFMDVEGRWSRPDASLVVACRSDETCEAALLSAVAEVCGSVDTDALLAERARLWALIEADVASDPRRRVDFDRVVDAQADTDDWIARRSAVLMEQWELDGVGD